MHLDLRPSLIGWTVLNLCYMSYQRHTTGGVSLPMILVTVFQGFYTWDALWMERAILSTVDITTGAAATSQKLVSYLTNGP